MSLLPALFLRGERLLPLGTPVRPVPSQVAAKQPVPDWRFATAGDKPPKKVRLHLTDWADAEAAAFIDAYGSGNCSCHISPPCGSCTHPGNPLNLEEDDEAWVMGFEGSAA